jgi:hypothetical protein
MFFKAGDTKTGFSHRTVDLLDSVLVSVDVIERNSSNVF